MSKFSLELSVENFDSYKRTVLEARKLALDTNEAVKNFGKNSGFGETNKEARDFINLQTQIARQEKAVEQSKQATIKTQLEEIRLEKELQKNSAASLSQNLQQEKAGAQAKQATIKAQLEQIRLDKEQARTAGQSQKALQTSAEKAFRTTGAEIKKQAAFQKEVDQIKSGSTGFGRNALNAASAIPGVGNLAQGFAFGGGAGLAVAAVLEAREKVTAFITTLKDLGAEAIRIGADFEETRNSLIVFAGSANQADKELAAIDETARNTPGLRLESAEAGFKQLRALGFEAENARKLVAGIGKERLLSGANEQDVQRVIVNLTQLSSGSSRASQDIKEIYHAMPALRKEFALAFGTLDPKKIAKEFEQDAAGAIAKLTEQLEKTKGAAGGLNDAYGKFTDEFILAGREFSKPIIPELTKDVRALTDFVSENKDGFAVWGEVVAGSISDVGKIIKEVKDSFEAVDKLLPKNSNRKDLRETVFDINNNPSSFTTPLQLTPAEQEKLFGIKDNTKDAFKANSYADASAASAQAYADALDSISTLREQAEFNALQAEEQFNKKVTDLVKKTTDEQSAIRKNYYSVEEVRLSVHRDITLDDQLHTADSLRRLKEQSIKEEIDLETGKFKSLIKLNEGNAEEITKLESDRNKTLSTLSAQLEINQLNAQKEVLNLVQKAKDSLVDFAGFLNSSQLSENQFVSVFNDIDTAGERMEKRFGSIGREAVKMATAIEKTNLGKKLNLLSFQSDSKALKFTQDAVRLSVLPDNQFTSFQKAIENFESSVNFFVKDNQTGRRIAEASFYADRYNPNNPKSFAEFNRRGQSDDISDIGLQIRSAKEDIEVIKRQSLNGTGVYGRGIAADAELSVIPPIKELIERLNNPRTRGDAQFLLNEYRDSLVNSRDAQRQRFQDNLEQQKTFEFGKVFAREQIDLINKSGLTDVEKAKQRADVVTSLGNDLDPSLRKQGIKDLLANAKEERAQKDKGFDLASKTASGIAELNKKLDSVIVNNKLKIDGSGLPSTNVFVDGNDVSVDKSKSTATNADTRTYYQQYESQR